jgi:hypothetical protein
MANRACPLCFTRVPRMLVLCQSYELECPACHTPLEVSRGTRVLSAAVGLLLGFSAVELMPSLSATAVWTLQVVVGSVAFGVGAAALLFFFSDLVVRPNPAGAGHTFPHP